MRTVKVEFEIIKFKIFLYHMVFELLIAHHLKNASHDKALETITIPKIRSMPQK